MAHKIAYVFIAACVVIAALISFNVLRLSSRQAVVAQFVPPAVDVRGAAERLAGAVRLQTISYETPSESSRQALLQFQSYLQDASPKHTQRRDVKS
jgi:carboxypeptidase PM20D1